MYNNIELINTVNHKDTAIKAYDSFSYAKNMISAPVTVFEFYDCCKDYPIVFVKDAQDNWMASAMLGYEENKNLFVNDTGEWGKLRYVPASIRRYPFIFVNQDDSQLSLAFDSDAKSESPIDNERKLFDEEGKPSEFLKGVLEFMNQFQNEAASTNSFIKQLSDWELLEEKTAQITTPDQKSHQVNGFYIVNEEKLNHLSKKKKEDICDKNAYPLITAHLISLSNIQRMGIRV